uniref:RNA-binding protein 28 n=1 Tax=Panagrellus redivivus TaxID=6233 RepID=A0A7E4VXK1_PANRE
MPPKFENVPYQANSNPVRSGIKAWRLIVRNLDDYTKKDELVNLFSPFGTLKEVVQPKSKIKEKANAPFAFVQFASKPDADNALKALNGSTFKNRKITVNVSIDKDSYVTQQHEAKPKAPKRPLPKDDDSDEESEEDVKEVKPVIVKKEAPKKAKKKTVADSRLPGFSDILEGTDSEESEEEEEEADSEDESDADVESEEDSDPEGGEAESEDEASEPSAKKSKFEHSGPRPADKATEEGRVVFLKNLSYNTDDDILKEYMAKFGEVSLAILCTFKDTDQPTGTAFVHFATKESADAALEQLASEEGIVIDGRRLHGFRAVAREKAKDFKAPDKTASDKRNLYLLRVGLIRPGTALANDMSDSDAAKRVSLMNAAKLKLKNLHMFVSPTRLLIHNVPFSMNDKDLQKIVLELVRSKNPKAYVTECRIMRKKVEKVGNRLKLGPSKGFAFVEFTDHIDALTCLRKMNNNPTIFKNERRPIVEFSIENRAAIRLRENRAERSDAAMNRTEEEKQAAALEKTKRELMAGGAKALPKKFGAKIRSASKGAKGKAGKKKSAPKAGKAKAKGKKPGKK